MRREIEPEKCFVGKFKSNFLLRRRGAISFSITSLPFSGGGGPEHCKFSHFCACTLPAVSLLFLPSVNLLLKLADIFLLFLSCVWICLNLVKILTLFAEYFFIRFLSPFIALFFLFEPSFFTSLHFSFCDYLSTMRFIIVSQFYSSLFCLI